METYSLRNSIKESAARHSDSITDSGLIFRVIIEEDVPDLYYGDSAYILEVIDHMITASLLRTEEGKIVLWISLDSIISETKHAILSFEFIDSGHGLTDEEKVQLLDYFNTSEQVNIDSKHDIGTNVSVLLSFKAASFELAEEFSYHAAPKPAKEAMISIKEGLQYTGNDMGIYLATLFEYVREWQIKASDIATKFEFGDWGEYRILVHALKSASYTIGAKAFGDEAKQLEFAARDMDSEFIFKNHMNMIENLEALFEEATAILASNNIKSEDMP